MTNYFKGFVRLFSTPSHSRTKALLFLLIIVAAIPLTVVSLQQQQNIRQNAATCIPRPACLDSIPHCEIAQPADGWCAPTPSVAPQFIVCGAPDLKCPNGLTCGRCTGAIVPGQPTPKPNTGCICIPTTPTVVVCAQVTTPARNPYSGQCMNFSTPCSVPKGWVPVKSCSQ